MYKPISLPQLAVACAYRFITQKIQDWLDQLRREFLQEYWTASVVFSPCLPRCVCCSWTLVAVSTYREGKKLKKLSQNILIPLLTSLNKKNKKKNTQRAAETQAALNAASKRKHLLVWERTSCTIWCAGIAFLFVFSLISGPTLSRNSLKCGYQTCLHVISDPSMVSTLRKLSKSQERISQFLCLAHSQIRFWERQSKLLFMYWAILFHHSVNQFLCLIFIHHPDPLKLARIRCHKMPDKENENACVRVNQFSGQNPIPRHRRKSEDETAQKLNDNFVLVSLNTLFCEHDFYREGNGTHAGRKRMDTVRNFNR